MHLLLVNSENTQYNGSCHQHVKLQAFSEFLAQNLGNSTSFSLNHYLVLQDHFFRIIWFAAPGPWCYFIFSVFTLAVITLERNYAITHAMHLNKRLSLKHAAYIMVGAWSFSILLASLPLIGVSDYRKFAICLPFETEGALSLGYVIFLLLINGVAFSILMGCYLKMYCAIRGSQVQVYKFCF